MDSQKKKNFTEKAKGGNLVDAFISVLDDITHLQINTIVEEKIEQSIEQDDDLLSDVGELESKSIPDPGTTISTEIGLLDGDITNVIGSVFIKDADYEKLRDFHQEQVLKGEQIIQNNLTAVYKIVIYISDLAKRQSPNQGTE